MKCGLCKLTAGYGRSHCFHFEGTQEGYLRFSAPAQKITKVRALSSFRTVLSGECTYEISGQKYRLSAGECLALNADDEFDLCLPAQTQLLTVCFDEDRANDVAAAASTPDELLIDTPPKHLSGPVNFPRQVFQQDPTIASIIQSLNATVVNEIDQLDPLFSSLYRKLLVTHSGAILSIADLSAKRAPVRVEIQRRLAIAHEYIAANLREPIDLESIAAIASMSKHHFIRSFRQAYKITPYRLILELRLRAARADLERGEVSVTSIACRYRFANIQTFSKAFKQLFGVSPSTIIPDHDNQT